MRTDESKAVRNWPTRGQWPTTTQRDTEARLLRPRKSLPHPLRGDTTGSNEGAINVDNKQTRLRNHAYLQPSLVIWNDEGEHSRLDQTEIVRIVSIPSHRRPNPLPTPLDGVFNSTPRLLGAAGRGAVNPNLERSMSVSVRSVDRTSTSLMIDVLVIVFFASLTAIAGRIALFLPFSPVPVTAQTLITLLAGASLGWRRGALSQITYVASGLAGLPVFAAGTAGITVLLGPTGGYLVGFVASAAVVGWLIERAPRRGMTRTPLTLAIMALGSATIYVFGVAWLTHFLPGGLSTALLAGVAPFLPGDVLKCLLAAGVIPSARWTMSRWRAL